MPALSSSNEVPLNLSNGMLGQVFANFRDNSILHVRVQGASQIRKRARRGGNDQRLHVARANELFHSNSNMTHETMFLNFMPIGRFHTAAKIRARTLECPPGTIGPLFMGGRVVVHENALGRQVDELLVAGVTQKQRLSTVTDKDECIMGKRELIHTELSHIKTGLFTGNPQDAFACGPLFSGIGIAIPDIGSTQTR
jgi:hypothetical protein